MQRVLACLLMSFYTVICWRGVLCVPQDVELGLYYMENAAHQGLPAALEQLGRCCYSRGTLVQQDKRAIPIPYLH